MNINPILRASACMLLAGRSFAAAGDTTIVVNSGPGILETTINSDVNGTARKNPNRVYLLQRDQVYVQKAPIAVINPTGTLTIVGEPGGRKPIIVMSPAAGARIAQNTVQGSIKFVNIHYQGMQLDGTQNVENWFMTTGPASPGGPNLPQSLTIDSCLFEFANIDFFECNAWSSGAKFFITNSYFRNLFHPGQWWGSRVFMCKNPVDTLWVENVTTTGGGLTFLMQNSLTRFAYLNHNTIVNNKKYWLLSPYYLTYIVTNNIFINHSWAGEDTTIIYDEDRGHKALTSAINLDTTNAPGSTVKVQPQYRTVGNLGYTGEVGLDRVRAFVSNNVYYDDTLMTGYYINRNNAFNNVGPYPVSYLNWFGWGKGPWIVRNVPGQWMNDRTRGLFAAYPHAMIEENTIFADPQTVTPGIKNAAVALQMALWNDAQWGVPHVAANDIVHSAYIFGDYDPKTIPGVINGQKTEDAGSAAGIRKFTDLTEDFNQSAHLSTIDGLPIGSLIWNDTEFAAYSSSADFQKVIAKYIALGGSWTGIRAGPGAPDGFTLSQNFPNPFNPSTTIRYGLPHREHVKLEVFTTLGQKVAEPVHGDIDAGEHSIQFNAGNLASGVYFYRLSAGSYGATMKLLLLK